MIKILMLSCLFLNVTFIKSSELDFEKHCKNLKYFSPEERALLKEVALKKIDSHTRLNEVDSLCNQFLKDLPLEDRKQEILTQYYNLKTTLTELEKELEKEEKSLMHSYDNATQEEKIEYRELSEKTIEECNMNISQIQENIRKFESKHKYALIEMGLLQSNSTLNSQ